ncbi:MAG: NAD(+) synthase [Candidatus Falkowbacteria bacterium]
MYKLTQQQLADVAKYASSNLYAYCVKNNIHHLVVGSSGGLDSAVTLKLAQLACNLAEKDGYELKSIGMVLPCFSSRRSIDLGRLAIRSAGAEVIEINLDKAFSALMNNAVEEGIGWQLDDIEPDVTAADWRQRRIIAQGNIKARLRMIHVYQVAGLLKGIVLSTDNLSELWMGFWTLHGDVGDYGMIQNLLKGLELYDLARYLGVPKEIIAAKPDDGLGIGKGDEDQLHAPYDKIDEVMITFYQQNEPHIINRRHSAVLPAVEGVKPEVVSELVARYQATNYKRWGTVNLTRSDLHLPPINNINLRGDSENQA